MKIILDIDDVLADTVTALAQVLGPAADDKSEDLRDFFPGVNLAEYLQSPSFNLAIPPVDGAPEGVSRIVERSHEIFYLSARVPELTETTSIWLHNWGFPEAPIQCIGREAKKSVLGSSTYDLLIDDQLKYLKIAAQRGILALAYAYPWNESWQGRRFSSWSALLKAI
jgi:hypothetical protein